MQQRHEREEESILRSAEGETHTNQQNSLPFNHSHPLSHSPIQRDEYIRTPAASTPQESSLGTPDVVDTLEDPLKMREEIRQLRQRVFELETELLEKNKFIEELTQQIASQ